MASDEKEKNAGMLPSRYAGGPHGLGDPDDKCKCIDSVTIIV